MARMLQSVDFVLANMRQSASAHDIALIQALRDDARRLLKAEVSHIMIASEHTHEYIKTDETGDKWTVRLNGKEYIEKIYEIT